MLVFVAVNAIVWVCYTHELRTGKRPGSGDLARLGYLAGITSFSEPPPPLSRRHFERAEYQGQPVDMITIGDSFSNGGASTANCFYQDYIATYSNLSVMNIEAFKDLDFVTQVSGLLNCGFFDKYQPRYLLLSTTAKYTVERFAAPVNFGRSFSQSELDSFKVFGFRNDPGGDTGLRPKAVYDFISEGNFKFLLYLIYYRFSDHAFFSKTYKKMLDKPYFSGNHTDTLLFFRDDVRNIPFISQDSINRVNSNLNVLADRLADKGIQLVFMPVVDKYDLYYEHIVNNPYPRNRIFELLRPLTKRYRYIDTKAWLFPEVQAGVKDVFYVDDTHWTWKAPELIFRQEKF